MTLTPTTAVIVKALRQTRYSYLANLHRLLSKTIARDFDRDTVDTMTGQVVPYGPTYLQGLIKSDLDEAKGHLDNAKDALLRPKRAEELGYDFTDAEDEAVSNLQHAISRAISRLQAIQHQLHELPPV